MKAEDLTTAVLLDSVRRLSKVAAWHRRQGGRHADGHVRIANSLAEEGQGQIDELKARAVMGDEEANAIVERPPTFGIQKELADFIPA